VGKNEVIVRCSREELLSYLTGTNPQKMNGNDGGSASELILTAKVRLRRSGIESKLVYPSGPKPTVHARSLTALRKALLTSLRWNEALLSGEVRFLDALIARDSLNPRQVHRLRKLAFLAPDIMDRIIAGDVPESLTLERLKKDFPIEWSAQRDHFGLKSSSH
jgi:hypothetical protein